MVDETTMRIKLGVSPASAGLLNELLAKQVVTNDDLKESVGDVPRARVAMQRLRVSLDAHGISLQSRRSLGYWLDDADKELVRNLCTPEPDSGDFTEQQDEANGQ